MTQKRRTSNIALAVAALLGVWGLSGGCGRRPVQTTAAHKIADALPQILGPAAHYDVQVEGDPMALSRGRARKVHIDGVDVQLTPRATIDALHLDAQDLSFDMAARRLEHVGRVDFTGTMSQAHLTQYLAQARTDVPGLTVTLRQSDVEARVPVSFLGLHTTAALSGTLQPSETAANKLDFVTRGAQVGVVPLPAGLVRFAINEINPLIDLSGVRVPISVTRVDVVNEQIVVRGTAQLKDNEPAAMPETRR